MGSPPLRNQPTKTSGSRCGASSLKFRASSFSGRTPPVERAVSLSNCCFRSGRPRRFRFNEIRFGANDGAAGAAGANGYFTRHFCASTKSRSTEGYRDRAWPLESSSSRSRQCEREETRSTPSARWQQISTSNSSNMVSTTRIQTISGGAGDSAVWPPELRFDKKPSIGSPKDRRRQHPDRNSTVAREIASKNQPTFF